MPTNATYAFMHPDAISHRSQQLRAYRLKSLAYSYTIGVWEDRSDVFLLIG